MPVQEEKVAVVTNLKERMSRAKLIILSDYRGLTVAEMTALRRKARESGSQVLIAKNTLARIAAREAGIEGLEPLLKGPTALAFGYEDPAAFSKLMTQFEKDLKELELKGGVLDGRMVSRESIQRLAELPSREVLLGQVTGAFQAPIYALATVLQGNIRKLVYAVEALREKKAAGE